MRTPRNYDALREAQLKAEADREAAHKAAAEKEFADAALKVTGHQAEMPEPDRPGNAQEPAADPSAANEPKEPEFLTWFDKHSAFTAAYTQDLQAQVLDKKITGHEMRYQLQAFELGDPRANEAAMAAYAKSQEVGQNTDPPAQTTDKKDGKDKANDPGEMTDAKQAKLDRLLGDMYRETAHEVTNSRGGGSPSEVGLERERERDE